jgi:sulfur-oxidizing protein SoxY
MSHALLSTGLARRHLLQVTAGVALLAPLPVRATESEVAALIKQLVGDGALQQGRVKLDIPLLVENGNAVPISIAVDGTDPVISIHVFAEKNPLPHVATFTFGKRAGPPRVATRMRLATSQTVIAVAKTVDGKFWSDHLDLIVTLAACVE